MPAQAEPQTTFPFPGNWALAGRAAGLQGLFPLSSPQPPKSGLPSSSHLASPFLLLEWCILKKAVFSVKEFLLPTLPVGR